MDNTNARADEQPQAPETPEDVAILYSWANLPGAKYRDFSASRREYRAQQRARAAEALRQAELKAAQDLEEGAQREIEEAQKQLEATQQAEAQAAADAAAEAEAKREAEEILRRAEERAEQERHEVLRRQQAAEELRVMAERAQEEMLEARKRAEEQAARYTEPEQKQQSGVQNRALPGEITDPYYYSGPVDPAYFASTPGVRTAQAARVSTERKAYVQAALAGQDAFASGAVTAFRGSTQFGPSPSSTTPGRELAAEENVGERKESRSAAAGPESETQQKVTPNNEIDDSGYDLDDDYYDGDHATHVFSPSPRTVFRGERSPSDLHIRPATRLSRESERQSRTVRKSPSAQAGATVPAADTKRSDTEMNRANKAFAPAEEPVEATRAPSQPYAAGSLYQAMDSGARREPLLQETRREPAMKSLNPFLPALTPGSASEQEGREFARFEDSLVDGEEVQSRMFLPSSRRRLLKNEDEPSQEEPSEDETRWRDAAAAEGQRRSKAESDSQTKLDRFVQAQESGTANAGASAFAEMMLPSAEGLEQRDAPVQWRSLNRAGEGGFRRRQPGREPVARTARQPRSQQESSRAGRSEQTPPPAWLSVDSSDAKVGESQKVEGGAGPDVPAIQGDPGVPSHRPVVRPQLSSLRPRVQRQDAAVRTGGLSSDPVVQTAMNRLTQEGRRSEVEAAAAPLDSAAGTLQQSRERVASRWFALSGLMGEQGRMSGDLKAGQRPAPRQAPVLSVLSISGGVGKTSIVATLGRALSSMGEKVMLADTNVHGILPYYFGAREQRPGAVRTFSPPPGSSDAPVVLASYDADGRAHDEAGQKRVLEDLYRRSNEVQRVLVDAGVNSAWLARTVAASTNPWVLVPVAPDMNSVLGTQAVERLFQDVTGADGRPVKPFYVLNQYDPAMPLHLDVREVLRQFLGERLLPIMLQRTPVISEALAEGMTVIDYAPRAPIAMDYMKLAAWVRKLADPGLSYARPARWSER